MRLDVGKTSGVKKGASPFPTKYLDEDTSDLTATVKPDDSNNIELKLTPNATKAADATRGSR